MTTTGSLAHLLGVSLASLAVLLPAGWGAMALWYQFPGNPIAKSVSVALWIALTLAVLLATWNGRIGIGLAAFAVAFALLLVWWMRIPASNLRNWSDDVARMTYGAADGRQVTLHNVRNFDWRTEDDYTVRWETRSYDLDRLNSVDMIMSYWAGPAIAHMLISFGFDDGEHVVYSVEIRREKNEVYSSIGGFFKEFELSVIAADERDVIRLRTNVRGERDYLYRVRIPVTAMRSLFLSYLDEANQLYTTPRFYNTITVNCTTLVYHMMKRIVGRLPLDYRILLSGYLPEYVYRVHGLDQRFPLSELEQRGAISQRGLESDRSSNYSENIRRGIPPLPESELPR